MDKEIAILEDTKDVIDLLIKHYYDDEIRECLESVLTSLRSEYMIITSGKGLEKWRRNNTMI